MYLTTLQYQAKLVACCTADENIETHYIWFGRNVTTVI
jgi:uncharacterized protein involved in tolerance to divalent cations